MPNRPQRETTESTNNIPPDRHHGGKELPDDVQDRPEQNAGYDAAVRGDAEPASQPFTDEDNEDLDLTDLDQDLDREEDVELDDELPH
jgi:hypothetical protein